MVKELSISLDRDIAYMSGSAVTGSLTIEVNEPKSYNQISVFLRGIATVSWLEGNGPGGGTRCSATESYVNKQLILWRKQDSHGTIPLGRHTYPFQFTLPTNCPSSYQSSVGNIFYMIEGVVSTDGQFKFDHKVRHPFSVVESVSASGAYLQHPLQAEKEKTVGCWCCTSGKINFNAEVERSGFNVGEEIPLSYSVENGSGRRITVRCELVETVRHYASGRVNRSINCAAIAYSEPINPHTTSGQQSIQLPVPNHLHPAIKGSNIIKSVYSVYVTLVIPRSLNSTIQLPVVIGNAAQLNITSQF